MQPEELILRIPLPGQIKKKLSFCSSNKPQRVADWASLLKPTLVSQTSAQLYQALPEINQLNCNAQARFEMLEILRPYVQNTIHGLSENFLNQPLSLSEEAQKAAIIAQALQKHMVEGYVLCIQSSLGARKKTTAQKLMTTALHRAVTGIGLLFLRSYQIYSQPPRGLWLSLHSLFRLADQLEILDIRVADTIHEKTTNTSIQHAYLRVILVATSRPHQLSQNDVQTIYHAFGLWSEHIKFGVELSDDPETFFFINLDKDFGPNYQSRVEEEENSDLLIELNLKSLLLQLKKHSGKPPEDVGSGLEVPSTIGSAIIEHLINTWSTVAQRKQDRRDIQITAELCVGLSDCHYFLCDGRHFEEFLRSAEQPSGIENTASRGFTPKEAFSRSDKNFEKPVSRVEVQNVSQGGYCLLWNSTAPLAVQAGDLVGIKEFGKRVWTIGAVRWIRQKKQYSQLGVQVLSDKALPYAIAQVYDIGGYSDFMRALFLPQSQFSDVPPSVVTSSAPFQEEDRVKVIDGECSSTAKLDERLFSTSSIQQFSFHTLDPGGEPANKKAGANW